MKYNKNIFRVTILSLVFFFSFVDIHQKAIASKYSTNIINLHSYGADNSGKKDVSLIFQNAINKLSTAGGGSVFLPAGVYLVKYPVFVKSNIKIYGEGKQTVIKANISVSEGRCAFLVGDSYEVNHAVIENFRKSNARGWPANSGFSDIKLLDGLSIGANDNRIKTRNSSISNLLIEFDYSGCKSNWGGYGIQFSNAANCTARNIWTINACQAIGIGSDTPPASPGCVNVYCYNIHVIKPDPVHTYYSIGFIANSNNCGIIGGDSYQPCSNNSPDGSVVATNYARACTIKNIKGTVGNSSTAEGVLLNNSYGCTVSNVVISNAKIGVSVSFSDYNELLANNKLVNSLSNITVNNSQSGICIFSKFNTFSGITLNNCKTSLIYNINATNNVLVNFDGYLNALPDSSKKWIASHNTMKVK